MLQHIALSINDPREISAFYQNVLQCKILRQFSLNPAITRSVFNTEGPVDVFMAEVQDTQLEIFLTSALENKVFSHICFTYRNADQVFNKALELGYMALVKKNPSHNTYFIHDKSGNMFEIKEMQ
jgi:catechol 2,3-dioxygenase-like lactoylglutathione lyase family enzyme